MTLSKYPVLLFFAILFAKIIYIIIESSYNYDVLSVTTNNNFSKEAMEALNERGHLIASAGFTLFIIPLLYFFSKRASTIFVWLKLLLLSFIAFVLFYISLNCLVDTIVAKNQDKRYEAYYTNLIRYGMLNEVIYYNSFIDKSRIANLDVNDKILLSNIFLLSYADNALIEKFRKKGEKNAIELFIKKYNNEEYIQKYASFKTMASEVEKQWIDFNKHRKTIADKLEIISNQKAIKKAYSEMRAKLDEYYEAYTKAYSTVNKRLSEMTTLKKLKSLREKLNRYFRYQDYKKAQDRYKQEMIANFGRVINPQAWLDNDGQVSYMSMNKTIREEMTREIRAKVFDSPIGLSKSSFLAQRNIKIEVAKILRQKDILIPEDFDYSYQEFKKYYQLMGAKKSQKLIARFDDEMQNKIGKNDLKVQTDWRDFIYSDYLKTKLESKGIKDIKPYQDVLYSKDLANFETMIYRPKALPIASKEIIHNYEQFYNDSKIAKKGDEAIKLLYIPPIALTLSILALLLNMTTVIMMILQLIGMRSYLINIVRVLLAVVIISMPFASSKENLQNKILNKIDNHFFVQTLQWSSYWVTVNYYLYNYKSKI